VPMLSNLPGEHNLHAGFWDLFALVFGAVMMLLNTILYVYAMVHHKYPPLRAKNLKLISVLWLCMVTWYIGIIGTDFNLHHLFGAKSGCLLFGLWFRAFLGIFAFLYIHSMRMYIYIRIFVHFKKVTYRVHLVGFVIYAIFVVGYGLPMSILGSQLSVKYIKELETCVYGRLVAELSFSIIWIGWAGMLLITFLARNINTSFREYHEMLLIVALCSTAVVYETIAHHINKRYTFHRWSRVLAAFIEYIANQTSLVILLGTPVYNCIFHREEYKR
ncbi:hypothetical protein LPJ61_006904, partial [Coemansia biformis]